MTGRGEVKFLLDSKIILGEKRLARKDYHTNNLISFELLKKFKEFKITRILAVYYNFSNIYSKRLIS
jgi:hypothetical protein